MDLGHVGSQATDIRQHCNHRQFCRQGLDHNTKRTGLLFPESFAPDMQPTEGLARETTHIHVDVWQLCMVTLQHVMMNHHTWEICLQKGSLLCVHLTAELMSKAIGQLHCSQSNDGRITARAIGTHVHRHSRQGQSTTFCHSLHLPTQLRAPCGEVPSQLGRDLEGALL